MIETHGLDNDHQIFFYEQDFYVFSNFSSFKVKWCGVLFDTSEHAYHFQRFRPKFNEGSNEQRQLRGQILNSLSAHEVFKLAQDNKYLQRSDWNDVKIDTMKNILRAKVEQHEYVKNKLIASGSKQLIENSWRDNFWGWGPNRDGQNKLGVLWMEIRSEFIR